MLSRLRARKSHSGVTLIEVLVAMVVMSIGMLGIAGLQAATAKFQQGSRLRGMVSPMLSDITNRVRINADQAGKNAATDADSVSAYVLSDTWDAQQSATLTISKDCEKAGVSCSTLERSSYDMISWRQKVRTNLPQGAVLLSGDRASGFQATLMWFDKNLTDGNKSESVLIKAPLCSAATEIARMSQQNCCPDEADAPEGVRCNRFTFIP